MYKYNELFGDFPLTEGEEQLLKYADTTATAQISHVNVISDLYTVKKSEKFINELVASNEKLSKSNSKYAFALNILTGALVVVGIAQIIFNFLCIK